MKTTETKKRSIIIGKKEYLMPQKMSTMTYLHYLEVRDAVMDTEDKKALYTRQQFLDIMDVIIEMYGNQFTRDDMLDAETGLAPDAIIMEFATMDITVSQRTDKRISREILQMASDAGADPDVRTKRICLYSDHREHVSKICRDYGKKRK